jgi:hypothetical protein
MEVPMSVRKPWSLTASEVRGIHRDAQQFTLATVARKYNVSLTLAAQIRDGRWNLTGKVIGKLEGQGIEDPWQRLGR